MLPPSMEVFNVFDMRFLKDAETHSLAKVKAVKKVEEVKEAKEGAEVKEEIKEIKKVERKPTSKELLGKSTRDLLVQQKSAKDLSRLESNK
jgi:hypothetical protein